MYIIETSLQHLMVKIIPYIDNMKTLSILCLFLILANCSAHSVKVGKRCTSPTADGSFEKSFVWVVDKTTVETFDQKINKKNCLKNS
jgi:biopolymer transport protein ExbD